MAETKIGGVEYRVAPLLAMDAVRLQVRILKTAGPLIDSLPGIFEALGRGDKAAANAAATSALAKAMAGADEDEVAKLVSDICAVAEARRPSGSYERVDIDVEFAGRLKDMYALVVFVLSAQFSELFPGALENGRAA